MVNGDLPDFCCSFKFSNKKTFHLHFKVVFLFIGTPYSPAEYHNKNHISNRIHDYLKLVLKYNLLNELNIPVNVIISPSFAL